MIAVPDKLPKALVLEQFAPASDEEIRRVLRRLYAETGGEVDAIAQSQIETWLEGLRGLPLIILSDACARLGQRSGPKNLPCVGGILHEVMGQLRAAHLHLFGEPANF